MGGKKATGASEVGYGKPPKDTRWKPGQSGNPGGRPRRGVSIQTQRAMREAFIRTGNREVTVKEGGKPRQMPAIDAVFYRLLMKALEGDYRSIKLVMESMRDLIKEHESWQIRFDEMLWQLEQADQRGQTPPRQRSG
jgi:hypothetical protein